MKQFFLIAIFTSYFAQNFQIAAIGTYGITSMDIIMLFYYIYLIKRVFWDGEEIKLSLNPVLIGIICLYGAAYLSSTTPLFNGIPEQVTQHIKTMIHFTFLVFFALTAGIIDFKEKDWLNVIRVWIVLSAFINLFGIYQIIARAADLPLAWLEMTNVSLSDKAIESVEGFTSNQLSLRYGDFFRATSIFSEPSALASFNTVIVVFTLIPFLQKRKPFIGSVKWTWVIAIINLASLLVTFSMTGFVGFFLVFVLAFFVERFVPRKKILKILLAIFFVFIIVDQSVYYISNISVMELFYRRIYGIVNFKSQDVETLGTPGESFSGRLETANGSIHIWLTKPVFGVGLGLTRFNKEYNIGWGDFSSFAALAEMGVPGFIAFIGFFVAMFLVSINYIRKKETVRSMSETEKTMMGITFYLAIHQFVINFISGNNLSSIGLWIPVALIVFPINKYYLILYPEKTRTFSVGKRSLKNIFGISIDSYFKHK